MKKKLEMVIGISGYSRSGKDSVASILIDDCGFVKISMADALREKVIRDNPIIRGKGIYADSSLLLSQWIYGLSGGLDPLDTALWDILKSSTRIAEHLQEVGMAQRIPDWNYWLNIAKQKIERCGGRIVIPDIRFWNEHHYVRSLGKRGESWLVIRPGVGPLNNRESEIEHIDFNFDRTIVNGGSLDDLEQSIAYPVNYYNSTKAISDVAAW